MHDWTTGRLVCGDTGAEIEAGARRMGARRSGILEECPSGPPATGGPLDITRGNPAGGDSGRSSFWHWLEVTVPLSRLGSVRPGPAHGWMHAACAMSAGTGRIGRRERHGGRNAYCALSQLRLSHEDATAPVATHRWATMQAAQGVVCAPRIGTCWSGRCKQRRERCARPGCPHLAQTKARCTGASPPEGIELAARAGAAEAATTFRLSALRRGDATDRRPCMHQPCMSGLRPSSRAPVGGRRKRSGRVTRDA